MKSSIIKTVIIILTLTLLQVSGDKLFAGEGSGFSEHWSLNGNFGANLFYGDLSSNPLKGNSDQFQWSGSVMLGKKISNIFDIRGQLMTGRLSGRKHISDNIYNTDLYFITNIFEYNINTSINLSNLFMGEKPERKLSIFATAGIGLIDFRSGMYDFFTDNFLGGYGYKKINQDLGEKTTEGVIPLGLELKYKLNNRIDFITGFTMHGVNTDKLDVYQGSSTKDMFGYISLGFVYNFNMRFNGESEEYKNYYTEPVEDENISKRGDDVFVGNNKKLNIFRDLPHTIEVDTNNVVEIVIDKKNFSGPCKIEQKLPEGFSAVKKEEGNAKFNFSNQAVSFTWDNLTGNYEEIVSYMIDLDYKTVAPGSYNIPGVFYFKLDDVDTTFKFYDITYIDKQTFLPRTSRFTNKQSDSLDKMYDNSRVYYQLYPEDTKNMQNDLKPVITNDTNNIQPEVKPLNTNEANNIQTTENTNKPVDNTVNVSNIPVITEPINTIEINPVPVNEGVEFRIQVASSSKKNLSKYDIAKNYGLPNVDEVLYNGWYKYTTGSFKSYQKAKDYCNKLKTEKGISGAFVVAFKDGKMLNSLSGIVK